MKYQKQCGRAFQPRSMLGSAQCDGWTARRLWSGCAHHPKQMNSTGRHRDPRGLPARPESIRGGRLALVRHRTPDRPPACPASQGRHPVRAPSIGQGKSDIAPAATGVPGLALCLHLRAGCAAQRGRLSADGCPCWRNCPVWVSRPQSHAASRVRLQACCRWSGHSRNPSLSRTPIDPIDGALHGIGA
jgi:hypothetical protein